MLDQIKKPNFILECDSYKGGHWEEIPSTVTQSYVSIVPRKASSYSDEIVAMGAAVVSAYLEKVRITPEMIDEAEVEIVEQGYTFNRVGWESIAHNYQGRLPLALYGVEEGRVVAPQTPIVGIFNTDIDSDNPCAWLPAYVESWVQAVVWYMSTVASICRASRKIIHRYVVQTGGDVSSIDYMLHNFGNRATSGPEQQVLAGIAHAALFLGSDCLEANSYIKRIYNTNKSYLSSVEATEHSTMCMNSDAQTKDDFGAAVMLVDRLYACVKRAASGVGLPIVSGVIDTYDSRRFVREYLGIRLKDRILNSGGKLVARADSGDIAVEPVQVAKDLEAAFGSESSKLGYSLLNPAVGVLQGDGVKVYTIESILKAFYTEGFAIDIRNIVLGMGHGITGFGARDDFSFSMKATAVYDSGHWRRLKKEPITDLGKQSLSGLVRCREGSGGHLEVYDAMSNDQLYTFPKSTPGWRMYFCDGFRRYRQPFDDVRARAASGI